MPLPPSPPTTTATAATATTTTESATIAATVQKDHGLGRVADGGRGGGDGGVHVRRGGGRRGGKGDAGGELFKVDLDPTGMYAAACSFDKVRFDDIL